MEKKKLKLTLIHEMCKERNWTCLSSEYVNSTTKMKWSCNKCNNVWFANVEYLKNFKSKTRCCHSTHSIERVRTIAESKNFILLDSEYIGIQVPMNWKCKICNYEWKTSFSNINRKTRTKCPMCNGSRSRYRFEEVKEIAKSKNLACLDEEYIDCFRQMNWKCLKCERIWKTSFRSIVQNIGCIKCTFDEKMKLSIDTVKERIKDRPIKCLETKYENTKAKMRWKCDICDYIWSAEFNHICHSNSGCPNCSSYKTEKLCRKIFEELLSFKFPKRRPRFLTGLELDGYCRALRLAFEYQGLQHYEYTEYFHETIEDFFRLQERDKIKKELCELNDIYLIEIPYMYDFKNENKLRDFIRKKLIKLKFLNDV
jgi:hypothetical protein